MKDSGKNVQDPMQKILRPLVPTFLQLDLVFVANARNFTFAWPSSRFQYSSQLWMWRNLTNVNPNTHICRYYKNMQKKRYEIQNYCYLPVGRAVAHISIVCICASSSVPAGIAGALIYREKLEQNNNYFLKIYPSILNKYALKFRE